MWQKLPLALLLIFKYGADAMLLDLFAQKDRHGMSIRLEVSDNECSTFPVSWSSKAASINTLGSCVQLYDEPLCKGALTIIQPFHTIHQMDMSLINFAARVQSASACGPKIKTGRYVVQNADDASILTVSSKYGGFGRAFTTNASTLITKAQQWDIVALSDSDYSLKPREFEDNYPVSYDEASLREGKIKKKLWKLMSVGRGRYLIKSETNQRCLYKTEDRRVEEHDCRIWSPNQEWVLKEVFGAAAKPSKKSGAVGPGVNFNILSKVGTHRPAVKPPPEFAPIYYNVSALAALKRRTTKAPYVINKKIRRGPRPQTRPIPLLTQIRPPGLKHRPALPQHLANNNKFLLLKKPQKVDLKEFVPSDDRIETYAYYQQVLLAKKRREQELKSRPQPQPPPKGQQAPQKEEDDEEAQSDEEDDEDVGDDSEEKRRRRKRKKQKQKEEDSEEQEEDRTAEEEEDEDEDKPKKKKRPPPQKMEQRPFNPYEIDYSAFSANGSRPHPILQDEVTSEGFFKSVFSTLGNFVPSVSFMSSDKGKNNSTEGNKGQQVQATYQTHINHQGPKPPSEGKKPYPHLLRPPQNSKEEREKEGEGASSFPFIPQGLRLPKKKPKTPPADASSSSGIWAYLG